MFEGKTIKELSHEWNIPVGTLLSRKHRALAKLRNILENSFIEK
jgi:DNA-directed RNA polymerase specialized sigma24 family protein